ncbi:MAG: cupin domain-containing protein [Bryobacteraceae bacterium]|jgi:quercetin dioxygenase-like cupin family protein
MNISRRELTALLPALAAANAAAQQKPAPALPSKVYHSNQIPYEGDQKKKGRRFFYGANRLGFNLEMHETILGPGTQTHDPHKHVHEEIVIVIEGTVESYLEGKTETAEAGSVIYFASNQMHSARNAGSTPCRYYVIELRGNEA